jgi:glycosyltransferase involved in cell wall biosynthesis
MADDDEPRKRAVSPAEPWAADGASRLTGANIICVGYGSWDGLPGYLHHVMRRLAERNRVLYVEGAPPAERRNCRWLACSAMRACAGWFEGLPRSAGGVFVLRLPGLVPGAGRLAAPMRRLLVEPVRYFRRRLGFHRPILWCGFPTGVHLVGWLGERLVVYQCLDDYACLPGVRRETIGDLEDRLLARTDVVLASSGHLFRGVMTEHPNAYYMPVAVDVDRFAAIGAERRMPPDLARLPRPVVGYVGALALRRVDVDLLVEVARGHPNWSLCLIGPASRRQEAVFDLLLGRFGNVHFLGRKRYDDLPRYYAGLDAVLLPYRIDEHTRAWFPPQFVEAMAAGRPVVATELDAIDHYRLSRTLCRVARDRDEFVHCLRETLATPLVERDVAMRREHARRYDLDERVRSMETLVLHSLSHGR